MVTSTTIIAIIGNITAVIFYQWG